MCCVSVVCAQRLLKFSLASGAARPARREYMEYMHGISVLAANILGGIYIYYSVDLYLCLVHACLGAARSSSWPVACCRCIPKCGGHANNGARNVPAREGARGLRQSDSLHGMRRLPRAMSAGLRRSRGVATRERLRRKPGRTPSAAAAGFRVFGG